ncbi:hypothetical protein B0H16DRAFT_1447177 [Mycena metata]|uniref:Uncharacterized protein n=1 Tax=Mycena metata TaxID=1033252 RepID=A0AAD7KCS6_9AGAR|nr:hypothetical protein B0H16DRAFT_1447177 [Mycena metata]
MLFHGSLHSLMSLLSFSSRLVIAITPIRLGLIPIVPSSPIRLGSTPFLLISPSGLHWMTTHNYRLYSCAADLGYPVLSPPPSDLLRLGIGHSPSRTQRLSTIKELAGLEQWPPRLNLFLLEPRGIGKNNCCLSKQQRRPDPLGQKDNPKVKIRAALEAAVEGTRWRAQETEAQAENNELMSQDIEILAYARSTIRNGDFTESQSKLDVRGAGGEQSGGYTAAQHINDGGDVGAHAIRRRRLVQLDAKAHRSETNLPQNGAGERRSDPY